MTNCNKSTPLTVLLADDSTTIRRYARSILEDGDHKYRVIECEHGGQVLQWLSSALDQEFPDLIILDRNMPVLTGDETVRILKLNTSWQRIPVLFLTAQSEYEDIYSAKNALGVDGYLCKPFEPNALITEVVKLANSAADPDKLGRSDHSETARGRSKLPGQGNHQEVGEEMVQLFLEEAKEHIEQISENLISARNGADATMWQSICHSAHTIKGSAGIVGLEIHSRLGKVIEDYSRTVSQQPVLFDISHLEPLGEVLDLLRNLNESETVNPEDQSPAVSENVDELAIMLGRLISSNDSSRSNPESVNQTETPVLLEGNSKEIVVEPLESGQGVELSIGEPGTDGNDQADIVVLLIDDQKLVGETVRRMLVDQPGTEFHFCSNPLDAVQVAKNIRPTVILQDLVMPQLDGLELVRHFRSESMLRDVPLIVLSGTEDPKTKAKAFALGANDYMVKLPDAVEVIARIRYHSRGYLNLLEREAHLTRITWLAEHDTLTGCLNRRTWYDRLVEAAGSMSAEDSLAVAICDIDFFKKINDTYGHLCGDEALKHFVNVLQMELANVGVLGRWGGEEFGIFMPLTGEAIKPLDQAVTTLNSVRMSIEGAPLSWETETVYITMSVGVALYDSANAEPIGTVLSRADEGVYRAKESGRNQVVPM
jgi:two-component system chemotaxis family response regulator WspR